jgi:hypothetical protein
MAGRKGVQFPWLWTGDEAPPIETVADLRRQLAPGACDFYGTVRADLAGENDWRYHG